MQRNKIIGLVALILGVIFLFGQPAITAGAKAKGGKAARVSQALGLTADQKAKIKAIKADAKTQAAAVKADQSLTADAKKVKIKAIRKAAIEQIKQLLTPEQQSKLKKGGKARRAKKVGKKLGLTADQKTKIKAIRQDAKAQIKAVRADTTLAAAAKKAKIKEIRAAAKAQILQVLTPEQQAKVHAARAKRGKTKK